MVMSAGFIFLGWPVAEAKELAAVTVTLREEPVGAAIPDGFTGLSFEESRLLPATNGVRYFRPDNQPLINWFRTLGIRSLRLGGNTSDRDAQPDQLPGPADWESFFAFAKLAKVKVIYGLQLYRGDAARNAQTVKYLMDHYAPQIEAFAIGQEPSAYPVAVADTRPNHQKMGPEVERFAYSTYAQEWKRFAETIATAVPGVKFCGPGVHNNAPWNQKFIAEFGQSNRVALITAHLYPGGDGDKVVNPEIGRRQMLSDQFLQTYKKLHDGFVPQAVANGLPYRLEEVNSFYNAGAAGVSDSFAAALWGLDFMYWWAEHGAAGLNFHTGDQVAAGANLRPARYAVFLSGANGYQARPLAYGLKAFNLGAHGKILPVEISNPQQVNVNAYATLDEQGAVYITLINKENGSDAHDVSVNIQTGHRNKRTGQIICLNAPQTDVAATSGGMLGGREISSTGDFAENWSPISITSGAAGVENCQVDVPASSAVIIKLTPVNLLEASANH